MVNCLFDHLDVLTPEWTYNSEVFDTVKHGRLDLGSHICLRISIRSNAIDICSI